MDLNLCSASWTPQVPIMAGSGPSPLVGGPPRMPVWGRPSVSVCFLIFIRTLVAPAAAQLISMKLTGGCNVTPL